LLLVSEVVAQTSPVLPLSRAAEKEQGAREDMRSRKSCQDGRR